MTVYALFKKFWRWWLDLEKLKRTLKDYKKEVLLLDIRITTYERGTEWLYNQVIKQQLLYSDLNRFIRWNVRWTGITFIEIEEMLRDYAMLSGHLRAAIFYLNYALIDDEDSSDELFNVVQLFLLKDRAACLELQDLLRKYLNSLDAGHCNYRFFHMFTHNDIAVAEFTVKNTVQSGNALTKELNEILLDATKHGMTLFSVDVNKDMVNAALYMLHQPNDIALVAYTRILFPGGEPCMSTILLMTEQAITVMKDFTSKEGQSYEATSNSKLFIYKIVITGPQRSEEFFYSDQLDDFAEQGVELLLDRPLLKAYYRRGTGKKVKTTMLVDGKVAVVDYKANSKVAFKNLVSPIVRPGGVRMFAEGRHLATEAQIVVTVVPRETPLAYGHVDGVTYKRLDMLLPRLKEREAGKKFKVSRHRKYSTFTCTRHYSTGSFGKNASPHTSGRFIKSLKTEQSTPVKIAVFDLETVTVNGVLKPYMIGIYHDSTFKCFKCSDLSESDVICEEGARYIIDNLSGYKVFAHNLIKFDNVLFFPSLFKVLIEKGIEDLIPEEYFSFVSNGNQILSYTIKPLNIKFVDSLKFIPMSLESAGKAFCGRGKLKTSVNISTVTPSDLWVPSTMQLLEDYNRVDCELLYQVLKEFEASMISKFRLSPFHAKVTLPSTAYLLYRRITLELDAYQIGVPPAIFEPSIRAAYRGGRCEVIHHAFGAGDDGMFDINFVDFVSLYPAVAYAFKMPCGFINAAKKEHLALEVLLPGIYYCDVTARTGHGGIPFLPLRLETDTTYPVGQWVSCYTSEEINYARTLGYYKIRVISGHTYSKMEYIFDEYITELYKWKSEAEAENNTGQRTVAKLLLNSLLGKFGQKSTDISCAISETAKLDNPDIVSGAITNRKTIDENYSLVNYHSSGTPSNSAPQISCFITAYARIVLHKTMVALRSFGMIHYVDTDSIAFACFKKKFDLKEFNEKVKKFYPRRLEASNLGLLSDVYKTRISKISIIAPKNYAVTLSDGTIITKHAGFQMNDMSDENLERWAGLELLKERYAPENSVQGLRVAQGIVREREAFTLLSKDSYVKSIWNGARSQVKRQFVYNHHNHYKGTVPVLVEMKDNSASLLKELILKGAPLKQSMFKTFPSGMVYVKDVKPEQKGYKD
jgi:uncharacterized protein YlbG (UPF0298 family)